MKPYMRHNLDVFFDHRCLMEGNMKHLLSNYAKSMQPSDTTVSLLIEKN